MARLFGTDGVRGVANKELTCETAFKLGQAAVAFQGTTILIGKDTRLSGDMLEAAVSAGIMSMGGTALLAGIIPTPAIALLVRELHCDGGIVISASHNPPEYNGIKLFDSQGFKLPDAVEDEIEAYLAAGGPPVEELPGGDEVGVALPVDDACELYVAHAVSTVANEGIDFTGLKVALDVGHGASCMTSAEALRRLGAEVVVVNEDFDGTDINVQCGSTHHRAAARARGRDGRRRRHRARRRRRPRHAHGRQGQRDRRRRDGGRVRHRPAQARPAARRHRRVHRHVQPRAHPCPARRGHRAHPDEGGRPLRAGGHARGRLHPGRWSRAAT